MTIKTRPIKRSPALVEFSRDHHFGLLLVLKIRQGKRTGIPPVRISNYVSFFCREALAPHFADEEKYLFPVLPLQDPMRRQAEREHAEIRSLAASIREEPADPNWLSQFADLLEAHIRFEERTLFNCLQASVGEDRLLELLKEVPFRPHIEDGAWEDEFWAREVKRKETKSHAG